MQQLEEEQKRVRDEQQHHQEQLEKFLMQFKEEVKKVEKLQQPSEEEAAGIGAWGGPWEPKSVKPPPLPPFSRADSVPKDEASCEQWVWQAKEALKSCTVGAVRIAIIQLVRGEVREFVAAVGFEASVETLLAKVEDRFGGKWTTDRLQQEFYQITQEKGEKVRQFAGQLKAQFKRLKEKVPGRYTQEILKEQLFHGMNQQLKDSIRFCYKKEETTYEELFRETVEAKKEKMPEVKATSLKAKSVVVPTEGSSIQDLKQKIDTLTTVVKSSNFGGAQSKQQSHNGNNNQKNKNGEKHAQSPYKGKGPGTSAAGPFKQGQKPFPCYNCGGWGHSYRQYLSPGGLEWRALSGAKAPPSLGKGPREEKKQLMEKKGVGGRGVPVL